MSLYKIVGISGSFKQRSTNTALLRILNDLAPKNKVAGIQVLQYEDVPLYNEDVEVKGLPDSVKRIATAIREADGVYFACPEYNYSISGV